MRKIILLIPIVIFLVFALPMSHAKETKDIYSVLKGVSHASLFPNGRYWNNFLSRNEKYTFIDGLLLGIDCLDRSYSNADGIFESALPEYSQSYSEQMLHRMSPNISDQTEMVSYIDNFYSQPLNLNIPINYAWSIMCLESWGNKVEDAVLKLRDKYIAKEDDTITVK